MSGRTFEQIAADARARAFAELAEQMRGVKESASAFRCSEVEAIAKVLRLTGHSEAGRVLVNDHAHGDDDPRDLHHGLYHLFVVNQGQAKCGCEEDEAAALVGNPPAERIRAYLDGIPADGYDLIEESMGGTLTVSDLRDVLAELDARATDQEGSPA